MTKKGRKDAKGRNLRNGESYGENGRYSFRYVDIKTGKHQSIYANNLLGLREKEKELNKDLEDAIQTINAIKKMTLNTLFERYLETKELAKSTEFNYRRTWEILVKNEIGNMKGKQLLSSHLKCFYSKLSKEQYSSSTIRCLHNIIYPAMEMAVNDDIVRRNPSSFSIKDYGVPAEKRLALTFREQQRMLDFIRTNNTYRVYYPTLVIMLGTGLRCGALIGLTWQNVDMLTKEINIDHQLIYKNYGDNKGDDYDIDGCSNFIFLVKTGRPMVPSAINFVFKNIVDAFNKSESKLAKKGVSEGRNSTSYFCSCYATYRMYKNGRKWYGHQSITVCDGSCQYKNYYGCLLLRN